MLAQKSTKFSIVINKEEGMFQWVWLMEWIILFIFSFLFFFSLWKKVGNFIPFLLFFLFFFFFGSNSCNRPGKKALPWWIKYFHLKSSSRLGPNMKLAVVTSHIPFLTKICSVNFLLNSMDQIDLTQKIVWTKNCSLKLHNTEDEPKTR